MNFLNISFVSRYISKLLDKVRGEFGTEDEEFPFPNGFRLTWASRGIALDVIIMGTEVKVRVRSFVSISYHEQNAKVLQGVVQEINREFGLVAKEGYK